MLVGLRRAVLRGGDQVEIALGQRGQARGQVQRVVHRGGGQHEARVGAQGAGGDQQAAQDAGHVHPKQAAVAVHLVHDDQPQPAEEAPPAAAGIPQDEGQHLGVDRQDGGLARAMRGALLGRHAAAQEGGADGDALFGQRRHQGLDLFHLVHHQGVEREDVQHVARAGRSSRVSNTAGL